MAKRKTPKNSEQPELALDAPAEDTKEKKAESEGPSSSLVPAKNGEGEELTGCLAGQLDGLTEGLDPPSHEGDTPTEPRKAHHDRTPNAAAGAGDKGSLSVGHRGMIPD